MSEVNAKIIEQKITTTHISLSNNLPKAFKLKIASKAKVREHKNPEENKVLLSIILEISIPDSEELQIKFVADVFFNIDCVPEDYDKFAEEKLVPLATNSLYRTLDEILHQMGYRGLGLSDND